MRQRVQVLPASIKDETTKSLLKKAQDIIKSGVQVDIRE
jgi:hypothetical protein